MSGLVDPRSGLLLTTLWLLRNATRSRVSGDTLLEQARDPKGFAERHAREAAELGRKAEEAVARGWRPPAEKVPAKRGRK